jgi:hypothetical protein
MIDHLYIGTAPSDEDCAQVGSDRYMSLAKLECLHYIDALRKVYGEEPDGAYFRPKWEQHDFGRYLELLIYYDDTNEAATEYAFKVEYGLRTWAEAGMVAPRLPAET